MYDILKSYIKGRSFRLRYYTEAPHPKIKQVSRRELTLITVSDLLVYIFDLFVCDNLLILTFADEAAVLSPQNNPENTSISLKFHND